MAASWLVLMAVGAATFMTALDASVVNTVLPLIRRDLSVGFEQSEWVVTVYLLVLSGLLLSFGRLGDLRGHKRVFSLGFGIFLAASVLCATSRALVWLTAARAVQAVGAAMITSNAPALLTQHFPGEQRGRALGLQATMTYLGLSVGPSLGGWLAGHWGWPSVFWINLPVGLVAAGVGWFLIPGDRGAQQGTAFDWRGAALFSLAMSALLFGLNQGHRLGWASWGILSTFAVAVAAAVLFVQLERRLAHPMLDLSLFANREFTATVVSAVCNYICIYSIVFLVPHYLIDLRDLSPQHAGLMLSAQPLVMAVAAPLSGYWSDSKGTRWPAALGMGLLTLALALLSALTSSTALPVVIALLMLAGLGTGIFISPNNSALLGSAPRGRQGVASGILATARNGGMALGVGIAGSAVTTAGVLGATPARAVGIAFALAAVVGVLGTIAAATRGEPTSIPS